MAEASSYIYEKGRTFIVDKVPKNALSLTAALITTPYGRRSLVTDGIEFMFMKGRFAERPYVYNPHHSFKEIMYYHPEFFRKYLGERWNIIDNCFMFFGRFDNEK